MSRRTVGGVPIAIAVFVAWGLFPSFFKLLSAVPATEILAHRILWSAVVMVAMVAVGGRLGPLRAIVASPKIVLLLTLSAALIAINWLTYVDAVTSGHVLEASLGYFTAPLASVALGRLVLGERLSRPQMAACVLAALAVASFALGTDTAIWRSLALAVSFSLYGLVRKMVPVEALPGSTVEGLLLVPIAGLYLAALWFTGAAHMSIGAPTLSIELMLSGVITAIPLVGYAMAARRLRLSTIGLLNYITPSLQFLLGVLVYGEAFDAARLAGFAGIWLALLLYSAESVRVGARVTQSRLS
jgi:chloramphenicol-sensitive protein RarD